MAKLILDDLDSLQSEASALTTINLNFQRIATAFETTVSRDGTSPNFLTSSLDVNDGRIINIGPPVSGSDAARLIDITNSLSVDATLIPSLDGNDDKLLTNDGDTLVWRDPVDVPGLGDLRAENNLDDLDSASTARTNLGLGTAAVVATGTSGATIGLLNANKTDSGNNTFSGTSAFTGAVTLGGTVDHRLTSTPTALQSDSIGFRSLPSNQKDQTYTAVLTDSGKVVLHTSASAHTWTIPPNSSVAYPIGTVIAMANIGTGDVTVARGAGVALRITGTATDKDMTLTQHGMAGLVKLASDTWYISGAGVS